LAQSLEIVLVSAIFYHEYPGFFCFDELLPQKKIAFLSNFNLDFLKERMRKDCQINMNEFGACSKFYILLILKEMQLLPA